MDQIEWDIDSGFGSFRQRYSYAGLDESRINSSEHRIIESLFDRDHGTKDETMTSTHHVKVNELNNDNYSRWVIQIEDALRGQKLWGYVEDAIPKPEDDPADATKHNKFLEWDAGDSNARGIIRSTVDEVTFNQLLDCKTSAAMMKRIREMREPKTTSVLMSSMTEFFAIKWKEGESVSSFMSSLSIVSGKISACEKVAKATPDDWIIAKTLSSLPAAYSSFVNSWNLMAVDKATITTFREKLLIAERSMNGTTAASESYGDALNANKRSKPKFDKTKQKFKGKCRWCQIVGHFERDCRSKAKGEPKKSEKDETAESGKKESLNAVSFHASGSSDSIVFDSGASRHLTSNHRWFASLKKLPVPELFRIGDGNTISATHVGSIDIEASADGKTWKSYSWDDVLYVPDAGETTLFSTVFMETKGFCFSHADGRCKLYKKNGPIIAGVLKGSTYRPFIRVIVPTGVAHSAQTMAVWHQRWGHINDDKLRVLAEKKLVEGFELLSTKRGSCDGCHLGKQASKPHKSREEPRKCQPGERFHSDLCVMPVPSWDKHVHFMTFKDEASGYRLVKFLPSKDRVVMAIKDCLDESERQTGKESYFFQERQRNRV